MLSGTLFKLYMIGVMKNPTCNNICQMKLISLKYTFSMERRNEIPIESMNKSTNNRGRQIKVVGGTKPKIAMKTPNAVNSEPIIMNAVKHELITITSLGK